eukprot:1140729-Pelagomonas_calceolata.AAC.6
MDQIGHTITQGTICSITVLYSLTPAASHSLLSTYRVVLLAVQPAHLERYKSIALVPDHARLLQTPRGKALKHLSSREYGKSTCCTIVQSRAAKGGGQAKPITSLSSKSSTAEALDASAKKSSFAVRKHRKQVTRHIHAKAYTHTYTHTRSAHLVQLFAVEGHREVTHKQCNHACIVLLLIHIIHAMTLLALATAVCHVTCSFVFPP